MPGPLCQAPGPSFSNSASYVLEDVRWEVLRQHLARSGSLSLTLRGGSMHPFFREGDGVVVIAAEGQDIRQGDVVVGMAGERLVCHRVVEIRSEGLLTAGDAIGRRDELMPFGRCLGRVVAVAQARPFLFLPSRMALGRGGSCFRMWFSLGVILYRRARAFKAAGEKVCRYGGGQERGDTQAP